MSLESVLARARKRQAAQFTDTAKVVRPTGDITYDPDLGESVIPTETLHASQPCKVKTMAQVGFDVQAGQTSVHLTSREVEFPIGTTIAKDDVVIITSSIYNPTDVGEKFRVIDVDRRTWQACRRVSVEEATGPIKWEVD